MIFYLKNTREIARKEVLKLDHFRVWFAAISCIDRDRFVPTFYATARKFGFSPMHCANSYKIFVDAGMLELIDGFDYRVTDDYVQMTSGDVGIVSVHHKGMESLAQCENLTLLSLRLFLYLLGDIRKGNKIFDTNVTEAARYLNKDRTTLARLVTDLKRFGYMAQDRAKKSDPQHGKIHYIASRHVLGSKKR